MDLEGPESSPGPSSSPAGALLGASEGSAAGVGVGSGAALSSGSREGTALGWVSPLSYHWKAAAGVTSTGYQPRPFSQTSTQAWAARSGTLAVWSGTQLVVKPLTYRAGMPRDRRARTAAEA